MKRVLFVDPNPERLEELKTDFKPQQGYWNMGFTSSAARALEVMQLSGACDVVVSEIELEDMDGAEFFKTIGDRYPQTVRISLTDATDNQLLFKASTLTHQFLSKPCDARHLLVLITRAFAIRDHLESCPLKERLHEIGGLPSLPILYQEVMQEMQSDDPSIAIVAQIIEKDISMSAKLLQIVNSAGVGLANEVTNVAQAASLLGLDALRTLVLVAEMYALVDDKQLPQGFSADALWAHSLGVGEYAKKIAQEECEDGRLIDDAFMAGLLHDIGLIIMAAALPNELSEALRVAKGKQISLFDAEKELYQATHAEIGGYLLELWGLPDTVVIAIAFHDYPSAVPEENYPSAVPENGFTPLTAVHVANYFREDEEQTTTNYAPIESDVVHLDRLGFTEKMEAWWDACHLEIH